MCRAAGCARPPSGRWTASSAIPPSLRASRPRPPRTPSCSAVWPGCWPARSRWRLGEYTSVTTANEQIESEVRVERRAFRKHPQAEKAELVAMLMDMGMTRETAVTATDEVHRDESRALNFHLVQELGVDPREKPSPWVAAGSSFAMFAIGAIVPLIPYLLGFESLWAGSAVRRRRPPHRRRCRRPVHHEAGLVRRRCGSWHSGRSPSRRPILSEAWSIRFFSAHALPNRAGVRL